MTGAVDPDGSGLLASPEVAGLLQAAVAHAGGVLLDWRLDHVDASPRRSTTATYAATVDWPSGRRAELLGVSVRVGGRSGNDERAVIFGDGEREVAVWLYPEDPDLPGLRRAAVPTRLAGLLTEERVSHEGVRADQVGLEMLSYRPRRRAVLRATLSMAQGPRVYYIKVLRESLFADTLRRHQLLLAGEVPAPEVAAATSDFVLVLAQLPGRPLAHALFDEAAPCRPEDLMALLDALPTGVLGLPRRPPWTDAVATYAEMVARALPTHGPQLDRLVHQIGTGLAGLPPGREPTHGDFHEGQLLVSGGSVTGVAGHRHRRPRSPGGRPGLPAGPPVDRAAGVRGAGGRTEPVGQPVAAGLDARVDPYELRLRTAGVIISLATGPYRGQEQHWQPETARMLATAESLVRSVS